MGKGQGVGCIPGTNQYQQGLEIEKDSVRMYCCLLLHPVQRATKLQTCIPCCDKFKFLTMPFADCRGSMF